MVNWKGGNSVGLRPTEGGSKIECELLGALVPFKPGGKHGRVLLGAGIYGQPFLGGFNPSSLHRRMGVIELAPVRFSLLGIFVLHRLFLISATVHAGRVTPQTT